MGAADGAGGHLAGAAICTLQPHGAEHHVCSGVNGCVDTTQAFSSLHCLSWLKLFHDAAV